MAKRVYWDTCTWLALLGQESGRYEALRAIWTEAEKGAVTIITSAWAVAECIKSPKDREEKPLDEAREEELDALFLNSFVVVRPVDFAVARVARRLVRTHPQCRKPIDGAHLATALLMNADEMHTFDGDDLLHLDGKCKRADGQMLKIYRPVLVQPELPLHVPSTVQGGAQPFD